MPGSLSPWRLFWRRRDGATAVEFALVALPFFAFLFAIMEVALVFFANQILSHGVDRTVRLVQTGQAQEQGFDEQGFRRALCANITSLFRCDGTRLTFDVTVLDDFRDDPPDDTDEFGYQASDGGDIVFVRVFYDWPTIVPRLSPGGGASMGDRQITSSVLFRNEPFALDDDAADDDDDDDEDDDD